MSDSRKMVSTDDPTWRKVFADLLESPAEIAFLDALIDHYFLVPVKGELRADGMIVQFQVNGAARYRFDFLINNWLIVEVDGAAYHSSPEARARDIERDDYCITRGFTVLRIPAKTVFQDPSGAIASVGQALAKRRRVYEGQPLGTEIRQAVSATKLASVRTARGFARFLEETNRRIDEERAKKESGAKPKG